MQKSPTSQPAAALDNRQLDLPLFAEPGSTSSSPSPGAPSAQQPGVPLAPDGSKLRSLAIGSRTLHYVLKRSARRSIGFAIDSTGLTITAP
ncbi:MAG TPA: metal-dependent hydrolase, partial [Paraburkholderia sp.]